MNETLEFVLILWTILALAGILIWGKIGMNKNFLKKFNAIGQITIAFILLILSIPGLVVIAGCIIIIAIIVFAVKLAWYPFYSLFIHNDYRQKFTEYLFGL